MATKEEIEIGEQMRRIVGHMIPVLSGVVKSVDEANAECTVELTSGVDGEELDGVMLNVITANAAGVYGLPAVNANCLVGVVDGSGKWELLRAEKYSKWMVAADSLIQLNDGSKGGLVVVGELVSKINVLEQDLNTIKTVFKTWAPVPNDGGAALKAAAGSWAGQTITETTASDIENTKIKQG